MPANRFVALIAALIVGLGLLAGSAPLHAATATATLTVTATVAAECSVTGGTLAFGSYSPLSAGNLDQAASVSVACTTGTSATIGLDLGSNASGSSRRLSDGASNHLTYELYSDPARTTVWGNSGVGLVNYSATSSTPEALTVYGRIAGSQDVPVGSYQDSVTITVTF